jgi:hypothetical protein
MESRGLEQTKGGGGMRRGRGSAGPGDGCRGRSSDFQFRSKRSLSCFHGLLSLKLPHTVRAGPSVGILLPTAQFGKIPEKVEIHVFHFPVAVPTIALDIAVLACSGDQTHEHLQTELHRMVFEYKVGRQGNRLPHSYQEIMINCNLLFWIPYRTMGFQKNLAPK